MLHIMGTGPTRLQLLTMVYVLAGIILLIAGHEQWGVAALGKWLPEVLKEAGTAFVIATLVGWLIELARAEQHHVEDVHDIAAVLTGIDPEVWVDVHRLLQTKKILRRDLHVHVTVERRAGLPAHQAAITVDVDYRLCGLTSQRTRTKIESELDYHLTSQSEQLPRFETFSVRDPDQEGAIVYSAQQIQERFPDGRFSCDIDVPARGEHSIRFSSRRAELVYEPGSYNLYLPEFTKGLNITVSAPEDIAVEMQIRPLGNALTKAGNNWSCDELLFPGQGIELKFRTS